MTGRRAAATALRPLPGGVAFAAFFLPWAEGSGPLAGHTFSGYQLLRLFPPLDGHVASITVPGAVIRPLLLAVPIAASWLAVLAVLGRWTALASLAAGYLAFAGVLATLLASLQAAGPGGGAPLLAFAGLAALAVPLASKRRAHRPAVALRRHQPDTG